MCDVMESHATDSRQLMGSAAPKSATVAETAPATSKGVSEDFENYGIYPFDASDEITIATQRSQPKPTRLRQEDEQEQMEGRLVHFAVDSKNTVHSIAYIEEEYRADVWFSAAELFVIKRNNSTIARNLKNGTYEEGDEQTSRGLENEEDDLRSFRTSRACAAVIEEHTRQLRRGVYDPAVMSKVYRESGVAECEELAISHALKDYEESFNYVKSKPANSSSSGSSSRSRKLFGVSTKALKKGAGRIARKVLSRTFYEDGAKKNRD